MKKTIKRTLPLLLAAVMLLSTATLGGLANFLSVDAHATEYQVGDIVEFGSYPQTEVKDEATLNALNSQTLNWVSYGYYSGDGDYGSMKSSDYMKYADVTYNGNKYRAVKFTEYRPTYTYDEPSKEPVQEKWGYLKDTVYWFKFETLKWKVLDSSIGLVMCKGIIDSQAYNNSIYQSSDNHDYYVDSDFSNYANNYETSSIREWLNDDFYSLAFTSDEQGKIAETELDNSAFSCDDYHTQEDIAEYNGKNTTDKIFLLSANEVTETNYGFFSEIEDADTLRMAFMSDYTKIQGTLYIDEYDLCPGWSLRSAGTGSDSICYVDNNGCVDNGFTYINHWGIRPAMVLNIDGFNAQAANEDGTLSINSLNDLPTTAVVGISAAAVIIVAGIVTSVVIIKKKKN